MSHQVISAIQLIRTQGVGPRTYYSLLRKFGGVAEALEYAGDKAYPRVRAQEEFARTQKQGVGILLHTDASYPENLANTYDAPPVLFYKGNIELLSKTSVAVVGTRNSSSAGLGITRKICAELGQAGYVITSGLARGIDTEAHKAALKSGTIAVLAGGIDVVYPSENKKLYEQIAAEGLLLAESAIGTEPLARHFPQRNRIIAGVASGVLVVEAAKKSGSMITADYALREGRDVFAVPGSPLDPRAGGTNYLIKNGAVLVEGAFDIISGLGKGLAPQLLALREEEQEKVLEEEAPAPVFEDRDIMALITNTPTTIDELAENTGMPVSSITQQLLELELEGRIERVMGGRVVLKVAA